MHRLLALSIADSMMNLCRIWPILCDDRDLLDWIFDPWREKSLTGDFQLPSPNSKNWTDNQTYLSSQVAVGCLRCWIFSRLSFPIINKVSNVSLSFYRFYQKNGFVSRIWRFEQDCFENPDRYRLPNMRKWSKTWKDSLVSLFEAPSNMYRVPSKE